MDLTNSVRLVDRLRSCAELWAGANSASLAKLGRLAVNDSSYFNRIESPQGTTTVTLERFARFLLDASNWPDGDAPGEVMSFAHAVGVAPKAPPTSPDNEPANIAPAHEGHTRLCESCDRPWADPAVAHCTQVGCPRKVAA